MTRDEFWAHIAATQHDDPDQHVERLVKHLAKLPPDEIIDFDYLWNEVKAEAYKWNLWGAAYLINGGCSDDGFIDFRSWLVLRGRESFEATLADPDSLADAEVEEDEASCECYPGSTAWFKATGTAKDASGYAVHHAAYAARHPNAAPPRDEDMGENWDFDDTTEMHKRLPRLAAIYLKGDE